MSLPLHRFFSRFQNWIGILILLDFIAVALLSGLVKYPGDTPGQLLPYAEQRIKNQKDRVPQPPSREHPLGTLIRQQDILKLLVQGTPQALEFSLKAGLISAGIGVFLGASSAYGGGLWGRWVIRFSDGLLAVPLIIGILMIKQIQAVMFSGLTPSQLASTIGPDGVYVPSPSVARIVSIDPILWAIILVNWIPYARILHAMVTTIKDAPFVQAARAVGAGSWRIILCHLLPNTISPALVMLVRDLGWLVILKASLQFAGMGGDSIWGGQLLTGRDWIIGAGGNPFEYWWVWLPGTLVLVLYGISWNLLGDGMNEALDPRIMR
jgi:peptide/nickel transport system permease protein